MKNLFDETLDDGLVAALIAAGYGEVEEVLIELPINPGAIGDGQLRQFSGFG